MKKKLFYALSAIAILTASCDGGVSTKPSLASDADTIAYAYGLDVAEKGLYNYISQLGVVTDTANFRMQQDFAINDEADTVKRAALKKALPAKMDSLAKANDKNLKEFIKGMKQGFSSGDNESAYMQGIQVGTQLKQMAGGLSKHVYGEDSKEELNKGNILAGIVTILTKEKPLFENYSVLFESKVNKIKEEQLEKQYGDNKAAGIKFLEENKAKEGVVTLPDGLQYKVITEGSGEKPTAADQVKVHYRGTLVDGTEFDSSYKRGDEPTQFGVGQVIKGWTEALQLMPVGSKWEVYIPYDLAYGSQDQGTIKPFSALIFEVELAEIVKPEAKK
jgi:FKBP-type peptidyl-prolyl cis-trans isomerase FklB